MSTIVKLIVCGLLIMALAVPVFAGGVPQKKSASALGKVYDTGISAVEQTEGILSGCLKNCFSLFNPCLDVVKSCTNVVMAPIEKPFSYVESKLYKPAKATKKVTKTSESKKTDAPK